MLHIDYTTQFKKDLKLARRRQKPLKKIQDIMEKIAAEEPLEKKLLDHRDCKKFCVNDLISRL